MNRFLNETTEDFENIKVKSVNIVATNGSRGSSIIEAAIYANRNQCEVNLTVCGEEYNIKETDISDMISKIKERNYVYTIKLHWSR